MAEQQQKSRMDPSAPPARAGRFEALIRDVAERQDRESFVELFNHFAPRIKSYLMKGGTPEDQADELAQETMLAVWNRAGSFDPARSGAGTWIFTIARNKRIDAFRKTRPLIDYDSLSAEQEDDSATPADAVSQMQEAQAMESALQALPADQAALLYKSFFDNKSHAEIAKDMQLPLGTVKSRIRLALDKLRRDEKVKKLWL